MTDPTEAELADFMEHVRNDFGDPLEVARAAAQETNTTMIDTTTSFWTTKLAPAAPDYAPASGEAYRAVNRDRGLPGVLSEDWVAGHNGSNRGPIHRPGLYDTAPPKSLDEYAAKPVQSLALPKQGESDQAYCKRFDAQVRANLPDLAAEVVEAATVAYNAARERLDNGTAREDTRKSGDGIGISREAQTVRGMQGARSYRDLAANASQSAHAVMAAARQAEDQQRVASATLRRSGYEPLAGEAAHTVRVTSRQYISNTGMFR